MKSCLTTFRRPLRRLVPFKVRAAQWNESQSRVTDFDQVGSFQRARFGKHRAVQVSEVYPVTRAQGVLPRSRFVDDEAMFLSRNAVVTEVQAHSLLDVATD